MAPSKAVSQKLKIAFSPVVKVTAAAGIYVVLEESLRSLGSMTLPKLNTEVLVMYWHGTIELALISMLRDAWIKSLSNCKFGF